MVFYFLNNKNRPSPYPLVIRIIKDRKPSYIYTGQYLDEKFWDENNKRVRKSHPNATRLNQLILTKLTEANEKLLEAETSGSTESTLSIKKKIVKKDRIDFFSVAEKYLSNLEKSEKYRQYKTEKGRIEKFKTYLKTSELHFKDITVSLLRKFETYLLNVEKKLPRTVVNYLMIIRTVYNRAVADSIVNKDNYPFGKGKIQIKFPQSEKVGLSIEEVRLLENVTTLSPPKQHAVCLPLAV